MIVRLETTVGALRKVEPLRVKEKWISMRVDVEGFWLNLIPRDPRPRAARKTNGRETEGRKDADLNTTSPFKTSP